ncbi:MAG: REP-associated tyrosine transposase [Oceanipulchritudo sp.]
MKGYIPSRSRDLRKGRISIPGARYFVTCCTHHREPGLTENEIGSRIVRTLRRQQRDQNMDLKCATIMPDHVHFIFVLGHNLTLSKTLAKFKSLTEPLSMDGSLQWQSNFHDHRLRDRVPMEQFAYYIFMNPYRKGLLSVTEAWRWWILNRHYSPEFTQLLADGKYPQKEWLLDSQSAAGLVDLDSHRPKK